MKSAPLGKGLAALIPEDKLNQLSSSFIPDLSVELIIPNPEQPRLEISPESLISLADSIRENGVIEPLIVSSPDKNGKYTLIAGERRWRAAKMAQLKHLPAVVKDTTPQQMFEMAVIENIQRKDLNPLEEASAFQHMVEKFHSTIDYVAKKVGLSRPAVSNKIRLLALPDAIKSAVINEEISEGHARALQGLSDPTAMLAALKIVIRSRMSVRGTEELVRKLILENKVKKKTVTRGEMIWSKREVEIKENLKKILDTEIKLTRTRRGGKIVIPFKSGEELENIYAHLMHNK